MMFRKRFPLFLALFLSMLLGPVAGGAEEKGVGGVGLQVVATSTGELVVVRVVEGTPSDKAGLRAGDMIVVVDDFPLKGSEFSEVASRYLWGEAGAAVTLEFLRPGVAGRHKVNLRRVPLDPNIKTPPGMQMLSPGDN